MLCCESELRVIVIRMEVTRDLYNLNLFAQLLKLLPKILFNLANVDIAEAILMQISAEQMPTIHRGAPKF